MLKAVVVLSKMILTDEMLKEAFTRYAEMMLQALPSEEELARQHTFSPEFEAKMQKLINGI
jgi:hypothetical protein